MHFAALLNGKKFIFIGLTNGNGKGMSVELIFIIYTVSPPPPKKNT